MTLRRIDSPTTYLGVGNSKQLKEPDGSFIPIIEIDTETGIIYVGGQVVGGGGGGGGLSSVTVHCTAAMLNTLGGSPITLVAAPGSGKAIIPVQIVAQYAPGGTPFTVSGTDAFQILTSGSGAAPFAALNTAILQSGSKTLGIFLNNSTDGVSVFQFVEPQIRYENQSLTMWNIDAGPSGGDGDLYVSVYYSVLSLV